MPTPHRSPLLAALRALRNPEDPIPAGYRTLPQWAKRWGLSNSRARALLRTAVTEKVLVVVRLRRRDILSRAQLIPYYGERKNARRPASQSRPRQ